MKNSKTPNSFNSDKPKDKTYKAELQIVFEYLQDHTATASMVSAATGIPQKNICRYKRDLELSNRLWEVEKKLCKETGFRAWYLTTDKSSLPSLYFLNRLNRKRR